MKLKPLSKRDDSEHRRKANEKRDEAERALRTKRMMNNILWSHFGNNSPRTVFQIGVR